MGNYKKSIRGDNVSADEQFSHNSPRINLILGNGGSVTLILIATGFIVAMLVYLWIVFNTVIIAIVFIVVIGSITLFVSHVCRHVSRTRKEHLIAENEIKWSEVTHALTESLVAHLDRRDGKVHVVNAQQVQQTYYMNEKPQTRITEVPQSFHDDDTGDGFSHVLGRKFDG